MLFNSVFLIYAGRGSGGASMAQYPVWVRIGCFLLPLIVLFLFILYNYYARRPLTLRNIRWSRLRSYFKPLSHSAEEWLNKNYGWYKTLPEYAAQRFKTRMRDFLLETNFKSQHVELTEEMTWMMAATYSQLTIGLQNPWMKGIKTIVFDSSENPSQYVSVQHTLMLNWKEFYAGFANSEDGINEGIRILASLVRREDKHRKSGAIRFPYIIFNTREMKRWNITADNEFQRFSSLGLMKGKQIELEEFLSVTLVYFFEMPQKLRERHPGLYKATVLLMHWDPIQKHILK